MAGSTELMHTHRFVPPKAVVQTGVRAMDRSVYVYGSTYNCTRPINLLKRLYLHVAYLHN